jgi:hypothetical protein
VSKDGHKPAITAWQPFSFGGVAAFAGTGWIRLFAVQILASALVSITVVWFLWRNYSPVITEAVAKMPQRAMVSQGRLQGVSILEISENRFLAIAIAPQGTVDFGQSADIQVELRDSDVRVSSIFRSLLGSIQVAYLPNKMIDLSRANLEPWWGAWRPILLGASGIALMLILPVLWAVLAVVYAPPAKFVAWLTDRRLSWGGAWRLGSAALLPGALVMTLGVVLYGWRVLDLIGFGSVVLAHLLIGWVYLAISPGFAPRLFPSKKQNPFASPSQPPTPPSPTDSTDSTG